MAVTTLLTWLIGATAAGRLYLDRGVQGTMWMEEFIMERAFKYGKLKVDKVINFIKLHMILLSRLVQWSRPPVKAPGPSWEIGPNPFSPLRLRLSLILDRCRLL